MQPEPTPTPPPPGCPICRGSLEPGIVCADHPDKPWGHDGCPAEGTNCRCNPYGTGGARPDGA